MRLQVAIPLVRNTSAICVAVQSADTFVKSKLERAWKGNAEEAESAAELVMMGWVGLVGLASWAEDKASFHFFKGKLYVIYYCYCCCDLVGTYARRFWIWKCRHEQHHCLSPKSPASRRLFYFHVRHNCIAIQQTIQRLQQHTLLHAKQGNLYLPTTHCLWNGGSLFGWLPGAETATVERMMVVTQHNKKKEHVLLCCCWLCCILTFLDWLLFFFYILRALWLLIALLAYFWVRYMYLFIHSS